MKIREAKISDLGHIANNIRESDQQEVLASCGEVPFRALFRSFQESDIDMRWVAEEDGEPIAIFGCAGMNPNCGAVWLLGTDKALDVPSQTWYSEADKYLNIMLDRYPVLMNYVDMRNGVSIVWLRNMGFEDGPIEKEYGHAKIPFILMALDSGDRNV